MAVPKTKSELLLQGKANYQKLNDLINSLPEKEQLSEFPPGTMNRNITDVLAHLYHWHLMFMDWYKVGMQGQKPDIPAKGYTWRDTKELNKKIWMDYKNHSLQDIRNSLHTSHKKVRAIIQKHTNEELFEKKRYSWTGTSSLATYLRSNTSSHYNWAYNLIKKAIKKKV
ncbi:MAG: ClbS/DfsB family four-helix bundle protein [Maribacter sp.]|nr:ClbS/DfsB family four-helix bundle protein [Maribacter sp.]